MCCLKKTSNVNEGPSNKYWEISNVFTEKQTVHTEKKICTVGLEPSLGNT